jgi:putative flippase GtrA
VRTSTLEFVKYTAASGAALAVDFGLLSVLVSRVGVPYLPASAISFVAGGVFLYWICVKLVFRFRRVPNPTLELPLFMALGLVGLAVNSLVMFVAVDQIHWGYLLAKAAAATCTFGVNFVMRRFAMFSRIAGATHPLALAD